MEDNFKKIKADYEALFSTPIGQRVLEDIRLSCGVDKAIFNTDAATFALNEGRRHVGIHILYMATPRPEEKKEVAVV